MAARVLALVLVVCLNSGCGSPSAPPPNPEPPAIDVTPSNRLGWDQQAADTDTLAMFGYAAYVDGTGRFVLTGVSCGPVPGPSGFGCSSQLPPMSVGVHTIELATFVVAGGSMTEGARSSPIRVNVTKQILAAESIWSNSNLIATADQQLRVELVAEGLGEPTDMGFAPDGRLFVTEQSGRVRVVEKDRLQRDPALQLDDVALANGGGLLAMAVDPQFSSSHFIYLMYTARSRRDVLTFQLARFREVLGTLGERAILLDGIPASQGAHAALRFGKDGKLYAAFDDRGDADLRENLSSFNGKLLRLNADATTPSDNAPATPIYAQGFESPRGLDWQPATGTLWLADGTDRNGAAGLHEIVSTGQSTIGGSVKGSYLLPSSSDTTAMVFYQGALLPSFEGDLLIATEQGHSILRVRLDGHVPPNIVTTERLLQDRVGPVRALGIGGHGEIYFATNDAIGRLVAP
jgi:glucose/arabinose dehydrogenase